METSNWHTITDDELVREYVHAIMRETEVQDIRWIIEDEIQSRLSARGARVLLGEYDTVTMKPASPSYDHIMLRSILGEGVDRMMWDASFTEAHRSTDIIPGRFNLTKLKALATKFGAPIKEAMEQALLPARPGKLVIDKKEIVRK